MGEESAAWVVVMEMFWEGVGGWVVGGLGWWVE